MSDNTIPNSISFTVDAGLINRLGIELVGRSETAVSELVKNAYDADATEVKIFFVNTTEPGGTLHINDNGEGMDIEGLTKGFMRLSSSDKIHNPISTKFKRQRAGKKGIGRFATQRLGDQLTIITKKANMDKALKVVIDWTKYEKDVELTAIENFIEETDWSKSEGTSLTIKNLRDKWSKADIRRIYRYVSELLQPDYLSDRSKMMGLANQGDASFTVKFLSSENGEFEPIADIDKMVFNRALAVIEAYVDEEQDAYYSVKSPKFELDDYAIPVYAGNKADSTAKFTNLKNVHFKAYYFIYDRHQYYDFDNEFTQMEYARIKELARQNSGIKLYRNGFRVLPYGEPQNDWLDIDRKLTKTPSGDDIIAIPARTNNFFGFVELIDTEGTQFEETASREGLIQNQSFQELQDLLFKVLRGAIFKIASNAKFVQQKRQRQQSLVTPTDQLATIKATVVALQKKIDSIAPDLKDDIAPLLVDLPTQISEIEEINKQNVDELAMLRVLAASGLVVAEFVHEVEQLNAQFAIQVALLREHLVNTELLSMVDELDDSFELLKSYTGYFRATVSQTNQRAMKPINLKETINKFKQTIVDKRIDTDLKFLDYELKTCPMHPSEWNSILSNLYSNAKKAINRAGVAGKLKIEVTNRNNVITLNFMDNGDGIDKAYQERIFEPFFTTANPIDHERQDIKRDISGSGLGLYIIKGILQSYKGTIQLAEPTEGYKTCFRITLPANKK